MGKSGSTKFVWCDDQGRGRNLYACFRRSFELQGKPNSAVMHLFADSAYQLFVNGRFVQFGPARFDPRFPLYDSVDLAPYLGAGPNVIAVSVNSFQHKTYKAISNKAGFVAWGRVTTPAADSIKLDTAPRAWRCVPDRAHARYVGKFSFALNAADLYDQAGELEGWTEAAFDDRDWLFAVPLDNQNAWGQLEPRTIPFMAGTPVPVTGVRHVLPLLDLEDRVSLAVPMPHQHEENKDEFSGKIHFTTWIQSPEDQDVVAGTFWGDQWINGEKVARGAECPIRPLRINQVWRLRKGWNHLVGFVGAYQDIVEQFFALPRGKGLVVSADRDPSTGCLLKHTRRVTTREYEQFLAPKPMPFAPDEDLAEIGGWVRVDAAAAAQSPSRELSWDLYDSAVETLKPEDLAGHVFRRDLYPHGFCLQLDLGCTRLVLPRFVIEGAAGATLDVAWTEHLARDGMHPRLQHHYTGSDRVLVARDRLDWMPSHPRGGRYVTIAVRRARGDVTLRAIELWSAMYPVEDKGRLTCSDPLLNAVWEAGRLTQATNMEDAYVDCVGRERGMYGRDTIIQYHVNLACFGDHALMGRCMQLYGQSPDATGKFRAVYPNTGDYTIADFALNMVEGYLNYYEASGDLERVRADWDAIAANLAWFHGLADERKDRLLDAEWHTRQGVKAHYGGFHGDLSAKGYMSLRGIHCTFSCTYLSAVRSAAKLARALGREVDERALNHRADRLSQAIRTMFWDRQKLCFADNLERETHSVHASIMAVCAGAVSHDQLPGVRAHVAQELASLFRNGYSPAAGCVVSPNYAFYIFDGLYRLGLYETAENLMRQGWGWMLGQGLPQTAEYFSLDASLCHAWSASPTYYLSKNLLGIEFPKAPDLDEVNIRVRAHTVRSAAGIWPHPRGPIDVRWHTEHGKRVFDHVRAPKAIKVRVLG